MQNFAVHARSRFCRLFSLWYLILVR